MICDNDRRIKQSRFDYSSSGETLSERDVFFESGRTSVRNFVLSCRSEELLSE